MKLVTLPLTKLPVDKLRSLTMKWPDSYAGLPGLLDKIEKGFNLSGVGILAYEDKRIIGWLALDGPIKNKYHPRKFFNLQIFVDPEFRRTGVGTQLKERAKMFASKQAPGSDILVYPHDRASKKFFNDPDLTISERVAAAPEEVFRSEMNWLFSHIQAIYQAYYFFHWRIAGKTYYQDHLLFERLWKSVEPEIDATAEKMVGLSDSSIISPLIHFKQVIAALEKWAPEDLKSENFLEAAFKAEREFLDHIPKMLLALRNAKLLTDGLENFVQGIADSHEGHVYLLKQATVKTATWQKVESMFRASKLDPHQIKPGTTLSFNDGQLIGQYDVLKVGPAFITVQVVRDDIHKPGTIRKLEWGDIKDSLEYWRVLPGPSKPRRFELHDVAKTLSELNVDEMTDAEVAELAEMFPPERDRQHLSNRKLAACFQSERI